RRRRKCPGCESILLPIDRVCPRCELDQDSPLAMDVERVRFALKEVDALTERGELDAETSSRVAARLTNRIHSLIELPPTQATPRPQAEPRPTLERPLASEPPLPRESAAEPSPPLELPPVEATLLPP